MILSSTYVPNTLNSSNLQTFDIIEKKKKGSSTIQEQTLAYHPSKKPGCRLGGGAAYCGGAITDGPW